MELVKEVIEELNYCSHRYLKSVIAGFFFAKFSIKRSMEVNVFNATEGNGTKKRQVEVLVTVVEESAALGRSSVIPVCRICFPELVLLGG